MNKRILLQSFIICCAAVYLVVATRQAPEHIRQIRKVSTSNKNALVRRASATTPKPGFFRTLFAVVYEQYADTRQTIGNVTQMVNDNFLPENVKVDSSTASPDSNITTTEDPRITRTEFNNILLRNLRGLQRLFRIELQDALKQSEKNYDEFRYNVSKEIGKFL